MLSPHQMSRLIITGPKSLQEAIVSELHDMKVMHIVEHSKSELADIGSPFENSNKLSEMLVNLRALIAELGLKKEESGFEFEIEQDEHKQALLELESSISKLKGRISASLEESKKIDEMISKNIAIKQELEALKGIGIPLESFTSYKSLVCFTGYLKDQSKIASVKYEMSKITKNFMLSHDFSDKKCFIVLFADAKSKDSAAAMLDKKGFSPVNFVSIQNLKGLPSANLEKINKEMDDIYNIKKQIKKRVMAIGQESKEFLFAAENFLSRQIEKAEAPLMFAATSSSFLIKGWVPTEILRATIERLNRAAKNKIISLRSNFPDGIFSLRLNSPSGIFIDFEPAKKNDKVPVKLKNPAYAKPFEFFMELYTLPTYKEIDPTFFIFLTFPLLFGFMLGDIGYGLATLILALILKKTLISPLSERIKVASEAGSPKSTKGSLAIYRFPSSKATVKSFLNIIIFASLATMFFGFIFGEFFGYEEIAGFHIPHLLSRSHQINELLYIAVAVGAIHVNIGLAVGFINELRLHGIKHAFFAKAGWFVFEAGIVIIFLSILKLITLSYWWGVGIIAISALMLFIGEGARGPIEIPGLLSNILSYARLMAIGVSSVKLAEVINEMSGEMFHAGGFFILAGLVILIIGHTVNIGLGLMGSFLHSLRLHYVEFFSKFFHGGAERYKPFGAKGDF